MRPPKTSQTTNEVIAFSESWRPGAWGPFFRKFERALGDHFAEGIKVEDSLRDVLPHLQRRFASYLDMILPTHPFAPTYQALLSRYAREHEIEIDNARKEIEAHHTRAVENAAEVALSMFLIYLTEHGPAHMFYTIMDSAATQAIDMLWMDDDLVEYHCDRCCEGGPYTELRPVEFRERMFEMQRRYTPGYDHRGFSLSDRKPGRPSGSRAFRMAEIRRMYARRCEIVKLLRIQGVSNAADRADEMAADEFHVSVTSLRKHFARLPQVIRARTREKVYSKLIRE